MMLAGIIVMVFTAPLIGRLADTVDGPILVSIAFVSRFLSIIGTLFVKDPTSWFSYIVVVMTV